MTKADHSENLVYYLGTFTANKVNSTGVDASTFRRVKGACSVIPFKSACTLVRGAPLSVVIGYIDFYL